MTTVKFDPGFAQFVEHFSCNIETFSQILGATQSLHQKKFKYRTFYPQIMNLIKNNVAFYYGCLIWAFVLVKENENESLEIEGNSFLNLTQEEISNYDFNEEVQFLINYLTIVDKDSKYYLGKQTQIPEFWTQILTLYKEFLALNQGFVAVRKTNDIKLPEIFNNLKYDIEYKNIVLNSIDNHCIDCILDTNIFC